MNPKEGEAIDLGDGLKLREVALHGGPLDGGWSACSGATSTMGGHIYVWDGGEDRCRFVHALEELERMERGLAISEGEAVDYWMSHPVEREVVAEIPGWRVNLWLQLLTYGETPGWFVSMADRADRRDRERARAREGGGER